MTSLSRQLPPRAQMLIDELANSWAAGQPVDLQTLFARYPDAAADSEMAIPLIYEELCLREERGEVVDRVQFIQRFPQWTNQLELLLDCYEMLAFPARNIRYPEVGQQLGEFQLIAELGRGAAGRVFVARQPTLSDRSVVLKVTPCIGEEHLSLARLQHSGIVPVYLVQEFHELGLRVLCMPDLGGLTLAQVLEKLQQLSLPQRSGADIANLLDEATKLSPENSVVRGPARQFLASASYEQAVCWIGACLADALHYAHERGLLHLDVKPSNVLLSSDGQPMLLDFHLARESEEYTSRRIDWIGGTFGYMSPEQHRLLDSLRAGKPSSIRVDRRTDIYSLGALLAEMLGGSSADLQGQPPVGRYNEDDLTSVIQRCLQADPHRRFPSAEELAQVLRRCLVAMGRRDIGTTSSSKPGIRLRLSKWFLWALAWGTTFCLLFAYLTRVERAKVAALSADNHTYRGDFSTAVERLRTGIDDIAWLPACGDLRENLERQLAQTMRDEMGHRLHKVVEQLRFLDGSRTFSNGKLSEITAKCEQIWEQRHELVQAIGIQSQSTAPFSVREDLFDLVILWIEMKSRLSAGTALDRVRRTGIAELEEANRLLGPTTAVNYEIVRHATALGQQQIVDKYAAICSEVPPRTVWEHYAVGRSLLHSKQLQLAADQFAAATQLAPEDFWSNFYAGVVAYRLLHFADAAAAFSACIALDPTRADCFYDRAMALRGLQQTDRAQVDFAKAQQLDPSLSPPDGNPSSN